MLWHFSKCPLRPVPQPAFEMLAFSECTESLFLSLPLANLQLQGGAITLETKAHIYTIYSSSLFEYPIVPLLKFLSFALSSKPPFEQKPLLPLN